MTFLNPILAAVGLSAIALPILIHILMRRRRKPIQWAAMRFLLEAYQRQRRRLRFEQWLLLAARCLLVALIALALGRPLLGTSTAGLSASGPTTLYLLLDDSLASSAADPTLGPTSSALARHQAEALRLLDQLDPAAGDRAALITLAAPARAQVLPPTSDLSALKQLVRDLTPADAAADLPAALALAHADAAPTDPAAPRTGRVLAILSDFRLGSLDARTAPPTSQKLADALLAADPAQAPLTNIAITALEPLRPLVIAPRAPAAAQGMGVGSAPVRVALRRSGDLSPAQTTRVRLSLLADAASPRRVPLPSDAAVRWAPGQTEATAATAIDPAAALAAAGIDAATPVFLIADLDADAVAADNTFRRPLEVRAALRVGIITTRAGAAAPARAGPALAADRLDPGDWFRLALQTAEPEIDATDLDPALLDAPRLAALDAVILARPDAVSGDGWRRLRAFADAGGLVLVVPPAALTVHTWPDALAEALAVPWALPREARTLDPAQPIASTRTVDAAADLLAILAPELPDLARSVRVSKVLAPPPGPVNNSTTLLTLPDNTPLLLAAQPGSAAQASPAAPGAAPATTARGLVLLLTTTPAFDWTDLQAKPLMVPLIQELVRQGVGRARGAALAIAGRPLQTPPGSRELRPVTTDAATRAIRLGPAGPTEPVRTAAALRALDDRGSTRGLVAINADPAGGLLDPQPQPAVAAWLAAAGALQGPDSIAWLQEGRSTLGARTAQADPLTSARQGPELTRLILGLLIAALALGVLELAMARWFSHAAVRTTASAGPSVGGRA